MSKSNLCSCFLAVLLLCVMGCGDRTESRTGPVARAAEPAVADSLHNECATDALEQVRAILKESGIAEGYDQKRGAIVAVASYSCTLAPKELPRLAEVKQKAFEAAYLNGLMQMSGAFMKNVDGDERGCRSQSVSPQLYGVKVLLSAESYRDSRYQLALAVVWSKKLCDRVLAVRKGEKVSSAPGSCTLDEWVENQQLECMVGTRTFVDADGRSWLVAVSLMGENSVQCSELPLKNQTLYLLELSLGGELSSACSMGRRGEETATEDDGKCEECEQFGYHCFSRRAVGGSEEYSMRTELKPVMKVSEASPHLRWFFRNSIDPLSGTRVRVAVCAIPFEDACRYCMARDSADVQCRSYES